MVSPQVVPVSLFFVQDDEDVVGLGGKVENCKKRGRARLIVQSDGKGGGTCGGNEGQTDRHG